MTVHVETSWIFRGCWIRGQGLVSLESEQGDTLQVVSRVWEDWMHDEARHAPASEELC